MGWQISYPLGGRDVVEVRAWDESKAWKDVIELRSENEWREFLEAVRRVGQAIGWEER